MPGAGQRTAWVAYKHREVGGTERRRTDYHRTGLSTRAGLRAEVGLGWFAVVCREQTAPKWSYGQVAADSGGMEGAG